MPRHIDSRKESTYYGNADVPYSRQARFPPSPPPPSHTHHPRARATSNGVTKHKPLQTIAAIRLPINHLHELVVVLLRLPVARGPIVTRPAPIARHKHILLVIQTAILRVQNRINNTRLQIHQQRPGNVVVVVRLVEEDVLAVVPVRGKVLQHAIGADAVLRTDLLPKFAANLVAALAHLQRDNLVRHGYWLASCGAPCLPVCRGW